MVSYLKKMDRSSVVQNVIDCLTEALLSGELKPGDRIPTEMELSEQLGVARNSVREAVKIMVYLGVLEIRRAEGTFVCSGFSDSLVDPMIYGVILNRQNTRELNELRAMLDSGVLRLAILKGTDEEVQRLRGRLEDLKAVIFEENPDPEKVFQYDNAFHDMITAMGHNDMVAKVNGIAMLLTYSTRMASDRQMLESGRGEELYLAHERVYKLVASRQTKGLYTSILGTYFTEDEMPPHENRPGENGRQGGKAAEATEKERH